MPRRPRRDSIGQFHHVMNRGLARRPLFDIPSDQRRFLALLACAVKAKRIRVHAFCLMQTHFHIIIESRDGDLSATMGWIQSRHSGHYNRTRGRDGPLVRGRFKSIPIDSRVYFFVLVRYLDLNPVEAGMCKDPLAYRFGSAALHADTPERARWLTRGGVRLFTEAHLAAGLNTEQAYRRTFHGGVVGSGDAGLVMARLEHRSRAKDDLDALFAADATQRRAWLVRRSLEADGTTPGLPMADEGSVCHVIARHRARAPDARVHTQREQTVDLWDVAEVGLLRDVAGKGYAAMARVLGLGLGTAKKRYDHHRRALAKDAAYQTTLGELTRQSLEACFGPGFTEMAAQLDGIAVSQGGAENA